MSGLPFLTMLIASGLLALLSGELYISLRRKEQYVVWLESTLEAWEEIGKVWNASRNLHPRSDHAVPRAMDITTDEIREDIIDGIKYRYNYGK